MLKATLSLSLIIAAGVLSANTIVAMKLANTESAESYANQYKVYPWSSISTASTNTVDPNSSEYPSSSNYPSSSSSSTGSVNTTSDVTSNWAGYVSTGGTYTSISGSWTVPSVTPNNQTISADASWIGIGGVTSDDLIQVGTQNVVEDGQVSSATFYEQLPDSSETISTVNVNPGDNVSASIKEVSTGEWTITINDNTNGESYSNTVAYDSSESSADWIEEAPSTQSGVMPLDEFGSVTFSGGSTTENGTDSSIASSNAQAMNMENDEGQALTTTSELSNSSFIVTRTDASADSSNLAGDESDSGFSTIPGDWARQEPGLTGQTGASDWSNSF